MAKLSTLTVLIGTVRLPGGKTFAKGKTFDVYAEAELPSPVGAADVPFTDDLAVLISKNIVSDSPTLVAPALAAAGATTSIDKDPYVVALADRSKLGLLALAPYAMAGSIDEVLGAAASTSRMVVVEHDGYITGFTGSGKVVTGSPTVSIKVDGNAVTPASVVLATTDVPVSVDLTVPLPVVKGQTLEIIGTTIAAEALEQIGWSVALCAELKLHQTDPDDQIDNLRTVMGQGDHIVGDDTYSPIA